jgi:uncharacterized membrane protein YkoI
MKSRFLIATVPLLLAGVAFQAVSAHAGDEGEAALLKGLSTSKHSLVDGILQATKAGGVAISAKFEDEGKGLSLSVYVAGKGLGVKAEENVLEELAGSPAGAEWKPETEVFEDVEHVARSAEQLTLMRLTPLSLADAIAKAEKAQKGTVFSVKPELQGNKPVFHVRIAADGKAADIFLDLMTGTPIVKAG